MNSLSDIRNYRLKKEIIDLIDSSIASSKKKIPKDSETTTKQQILILHYLGVIPEIDLENTKKAEV